MSSDDILYTTKLLRISGIFSLLGCLAVENEFRIASVRQFLAHGLNDKQFTFATCSKLTMVSDVIVEHRWIVTNKYSSQQLTV